MAEQWLPVVGNDMYRISDEGRVFSNWTGKILNPRPGPKGHTGARRYPRIGLCDGQKQITRPIHVLVLEAFVGPRPPGMHALHFDDDPTNNSVTNLRWGTPSTNQLDAVRNGLNPNANKIKCHRGHEFTTENTYIQPSGRRECRACRRQRRRNERKLKSLVVSQ